MLLLDEEMLLAILYVEDTLPLDNDAVGEDEVGSVGRVALRDSVGDFLSLILEGDFTLLEVLGDLLFKTRAET
jgi:hypothetical protein